MQQRKQQQRVTAGLDEVMRVGGRGRNRFGVNVTATRCPPSMNGTRNVPSSMRSNPSSMYALPRYEIVFALCREGPHGLWRATLH